MSTLTSHQVVRYFTSGGVAALVNVGSLFLLVAWLHLWYLVATSISFLLTLIVSFLMQKFWTFEEAETDRMHLQAGGYLLLSLANLFVNAGLMFLFVEWLGIQYLLAQVLTILVIASYGFFLYRHWIFRPKPLQRPSVEP